MAVTHRRWRRGFGAAALLLVAAWAVGLVVFSERVVRLVEPGNQQTDVIVALTGEINRLHTSIDLLKSGASDRLFISGVNTAVQKEYLVQLLDTEASNLNCCIEVGYLAANTRGNAHEIAEWLQGQSIGSVRLVTSNYHMPRSLLEFRRVLPQLTILPHPVDSELVSLHPWYGSVGSFIFMAKEFTRYLAARVGV